MRYIMRIIILYKLARVLHFSAFHFIKFFIGSVSSTVHIAKSTHDGLDTLAAKLALLAHIHTGLGVVGANDAPGLLLQVEGSFPGLVYVLGRVVA